MRLFPVLAFTAAWALACGGLSSTKPTGSYGDNDLDTAGNTDTGNNGGGSSGGGSSGGSDSGSGGGAAATDDDRDGFTEDDGDCNDRSTAVYPGAAETCNGRDDNCDGAIDEGACNDTGGGGSSGGSSSGGTGTDTGWGGGGSSSGGGYGSYGVAQQFFVGRLNVSGSTYSSGNLGMAFYGVPSGAMICDFRGDLTSLGRATQASSCTGCTWSFDLSGVTSSRQQSGDCAAVGLSAGAFDTSFDYEWGFANSWDFYGDGSIMVDETVVLNALDGRGWLPFAFNATYYGVNQLTVTRSRVDMLRPAFDSAGNYAYTYYYL